jgi:UDP-glucose 4-epimerase
MKKTVLISGIRGFLGRNLCNILLNEYNIYGIGTKAEDLNGFTIFSSSEIESCNIIPDFLILCHASISSGQNVQSNELLFDVNVTVTEKLIAKFNSAKVIYISSASIYDLNSKSIEEKSPIYPQSDYAISKFWAEYIVFKAKNTVVIRLSSLYGIGMKENTIIPNFVNQALNNGTIEVWGEGKREQNYIEVNDACNCISLTLKNFDLVKNKILLGVSREEYSNCYLAKVIAGQTNAQILYVNEDNSKSLHYNNQETCQLLGWSTETNFNEGIINYIKWKKEQF